MLIILAKCPNTVWVLHREKVVMGVVLSCYVVLCSRVVTIVYISRVQVFVLGVWNLEVWNLGVCESGSVRVWECGIL